MSIDESEEMKSLTGRYKHYCPDWDFMAIDELCPEWDACLCGLSKQNKELSMIVQPITDFPLHRELLDFIAPLPALSPEGPWIAGGVLCRMISHISLKDGDIDVFFANDAQKTIWVEEMIARGATVKYLCKENRSWDLDGRTVQECYLKYYPSLVDCLESFDFTICQFGFNGYRFLYPSIAMEHTLSQKLVLNKLTYATNTVRRLVKYGKQGYTIPNQTIIDILNGAAKDITTINTTEPSGE